ncbi:MAG: chorismate lyase [Pseudomonadales bacterium]|nr:chorismate lyase [Pseudomonadales bacterium]
MYVHSRKFYQPRWRDQHAYFGNALSAQHRRWLLDEGSLTAHLLRASEGDFSVKIISQRWGRPQRNEAMLLAIDPRHSCLLREVFLLCSGKPWVYARSVLPHSSLSGSLRHLRKFGDQPLGQLLFNSTNMRRDPFELTTIPQQRIPGLQENVIETSPAKISGAEEQACLGRRSRFFLEDRPLIVSEIFLPAFWQGIQK